MSGELIPIQRTDDFSDDDWDEMVETARVEGRVEGEEPRVKKLTPMRDDGKGWYRDEDGTMIPPKAAKQLLESGGREETQRVVREREDGTFGDDEGNVYTQQQADEMLGSDESRRGKTTRRAGWKVVGETDDGRSVWLSPDGKETKFGSETPIEIQEIAVKPESESRHGPKVEWSGSSQMSRPRQVELSEGKTVIIERREEPRKLEGEPQASSTGGKTPEGTGRSRGPFGFMARAIAGAVPGGTPPGSERGLPPSSQTRIYGPNTPPGGLGADGQERAIEQPDAGEFDPTATAAAQDSALLAESRAPAMGQSNRPDLDAAFAEDPSGGVAAPPLSGPEVMEPSREMPTDAELFQLDAADPATNPLELRIPQGGPAIGQNPAIVDPTTLPPELRPQVPQARRVDPTQLVGAGQPPGMGGPMGGGQSAHVGQSFSYSGANGVSAGPEDQAMAAAYNQRAEATRQIGAAQQREHAERLKLQEQQIGQAAEGQAQMLAVRQKMLDSQADMMKRYETTVNQLANVAKVDPDRWWNSRSDAQKVFAILGMALSGWGGRQDTVTPMIMGLIQNDIDAQKTNIANQKSGLQAKAAGELNMVEMFRQSGLDDFEAAKASTAFAIDQTKREIEMLASKTGSETAQANAQNLIGQLEAEKLKEIDALQSHRAQRAWESIRAQAALAKAQHTGRGKPIKDTLADKLGALKNAIEISTNLEGSFKKKSIAFISKLAAYVPRTDAAEFNQERDLALRIIGKMVDDSVLMKNDAEQWEKLLPKAGDMNGAFKLRKLSEMLYGQYNKRVESLRRTGYDTGSVTEEADVGDEASIDFLEE